MRNDQSLRAFTLTEAAIVLLVASIVLGGIWAAASTVWENYQVDRTITLTQTVVRNIRDRFSVRGEIRNTVGGAYTVTDTFMRQLDLFGVFPKELKYSSAGAYQGVLAHPLAPPVNTTSPSMGTFLVYVSGPDYYSKFYVRIGRLSSSECQKFLMHFPVLAPEMGVLAVYTPLNSIFTGSGIQINLASINDPGTPAGNLPFTPTTAAANCDSVTSTKDLVYAFKLRI